MCECICVCACDGSSARERGVWSTLGLRETIPMDSEERLCACDVCARVPICIKRIHTHRHHPHLLPCLRPLLPSLPLSSALEAYTDFPPKTRVCTNIISSQYNGMHSSEIPHLGSVHRTIDDAALHLPVQHARGYHSNPIPCLRSLVPISITLLRFGGVQPNKSARDTAQCLLSTMDCIHQNSLTSVPCAGRSTTLPFTSRTRPRSLDLRANSNAGISDVDR